MCENFPIRKTNYLYKPMYYGKFELNLQIENSTHNALSLYIYINNINGYYVM